MIHIDKGNPQGLSRQFFDAISRRGVEFDAIGLSYYPFWNGSLEELGANLASLSKAYGKDIYVAETAYDTYGGDQKTLPFPLTPSGQKLSLEALIRTVAATPGGHGKGVFYWAPEWIRGKSWNGPTWSGQWEDRALFDYQGSVLPAIEALQLAKK